MTKQDIQNYKDKRNLEKGFNTYWNKGFDEAIAFVNKRQEAINYTHSCTELKAFKDEFIEAWEDGSGGDSDLYRKAKSL